MRSPKATPEDPAIVEARKREQARAESARTEETQALTLADTLARIRRFGKMPGASSGSVPIYAASPGRSGGASGASGTSGGSADAVYSGGAGGGRSGSAQMQTVLY